MTKNVGFNYPRVIPRDLFNEGNLYKCIAQLYLQIGHWPGVQFVHADDTQPFIAAQNPDDGSLYLLNVDVTVHEQKLELRRPLNSREPYPLWLMDDENGSDIEVFTSVGALTSEFEQHLETLNDG